MSSGPKAVIPAQAGIQGLEEEAAKNLDPCLRRDDISEDFIFNCLF